MSSRADFNLGCYVHRSGQIMVELDEMITMVQHRALHSSTEEQRRVYRAFASDLLNYKQKIRRQ